MFKNPYFVLNDGGNLVNVDGEEYLVTTPKYRTKMIGMVIQNEGIYTQLVLCDNGIVMVTKVNESGELRQTTRDYYPKKGRLTPLIYKNHLTKLASAYETYFNKKLELVEE